MRGITKKLYPILSVLLAGFVLLGFGPVQASTTDPNYNLTLVESTNNGMATNQTAVDPSTGNIAWFGYNTNIVVLNQKTKTTQSFGIKSVTGTQLLAFSSGYLWLYDSTNRYYIINTANGSITYPTTAPQSLSLRVDGNNNVWVYERDYSNSTWNIEQINPADGSQITSYMVPTSSGTIIPFSDGSGFWYFYNMSSSSSTSYYLFNSATGATANLSVPPNGSQPVPYQFNFTSEILSASSQNIGWQNSNGWFVNVNTNGSVVETYTGDAKQYSMTFPMLDGNLLEADLSGTTANIYSINPNSPAMPTNTGTWISKYIYQVSNNNLSPDVIVLNDGANNIYALNAAAPESPYLVGSSATQSSISVSVDETDGTMNQTFQYSLYNTSGTLVKSSVWGSSTSNTFSSLNPGTTYDIRVQSKNIFGSTSSVSDLGNFVTIPATPGTPTATISGTGWVKTSGNDNVSVSWSAVSGATGYNIVLMNGATVLKTYDVGNVTSKTITLPDPTHDAGYVDGSGKFEVAVQAYNVSNGQRQTSPASAIVTLTPINQTDTGSAVWGATPIVLNGGSQYTSTGTISVQINATDALSGISQILVSNDNTTWTTFNVGTSTQGMTTASNYTVTSNWQIPPGAGQKTVYVKLIDLVGNTSTIETAYEGLQVNTTPPTVSLAINGGQQQTTSTSVTLTITAADPSYSTSQLTMSFSSDGQSWTAPVAYSSAKSWTLTSSTTSGNYPVFVRVTDPVANTGISYAQIYYLNQTSAPTLGGGTGSVGGTVGVSFPTKGGSSNVTAISYDGLSNVYVVQNNHVTLDFSKSGASYVTVSTDNISFSSLYSTSSPFAIDLPASDGLKTTYARLANSNDTNSLGGTGKIYFLVDTTSPELQVTGVNGATATSGSSFSVQLAATDNLASLTQMQYQVDGGLWQSIPSNGQITISGLTAHSGLHTSTITIKDLAGNTTTQTISFWLL